MNVYLLFHIHHFTTDDEGEVVHVDEDGDVDFDEDEDDFKIIGVFSSRERVNETISFLRDKPGFKDEPKCFIVDEYEIDSVKWREGYQTYYD